MSSNTSPEAKSGRASRSQKLSRERILKEGLVILDRDGTAALTMRRLATELGVTPMALYNHLDGKEDLLHGIAEVVIERIRFETDSDDWREQIRVCFGELRKACLAHPGLVRLVEGTETLPASIFRPMEVTLTALRRAGMGPANSLRAFFLLINFTMGQVSYQTGDAFQGVRVPEALVRGSAGAGVFPTSLDVLHALSSNDWDFDASFEFGISIILEGLASHVSNGRPSRS